MSATHRGASVSILDEIAAFIGFTASLQLAVEYRYSQVYIPKHEARAWRLKRAVGAENARKLIARYPGKTLGRPPTLDYLFRQHRDEAIKRLREAGVPNATIATAFGVSTRWVRAVANA